MLTIFTRGLLLWRRRPTRRKRWLGDLCRWRLSLLLQPKSEEEKEEDEERCLEKEEKEEDEERCLEKEEREEDEERYLEEEEKEEDEERCLEKGVPSRATCASWQSSQPLVQSCRRDG